MHNDWCSAPRHRGIPLPIVEEYRPKHKPFQDDWRPNTLMSHFWYDLLHQRLPQLSTGTDGPSTWHSWTYVTWFILLGGGGGDIKRWWLLSWLPTISLELNGRVGTVVATLIHAMLTNLCTEFEYRSMLLSIHGTLSEHLKPARHVTTPWWYNLTKHFDVSFDHASPLICGNKMPTRCNRWFLYCRSYCLLNMFQAPLCPSSGAQKYYTGGCCLWYLELWFSSCQFGVELWVVCPVCGILQQAPV